MVCQQSGCTIHFQQKGWNVIATMRSPEKEIELSQLENIHLEKLDVLDLQSIENAIQNGIQKFGKIDALVNNAGYGLLGALEELTDAESRKNYEVNVFGLLNVIRNTMPILRANQSGHIFNVSSIEEANELVASDPAVKANIFEAEMTLWYSSAVLQQVDELHQKIAKTKI